MNELDPVLSEFFYERIKIICLEIQFKLISAERNAVGFDKIPIQVAFFSVLRGFFPAYCFFAAGSGFNDSVPVMDFHKKFQQQRKNARMFMRAQLSAMFFPKRTKKLSPFSPGRREYS